MKFSISLFFYLFTLAINLWHRKFVTADATAMFVNNQDDIKWRGQDFDKKFVFEGVHSEEVVRWISYAESWTKRGVNKLFKKLRDTGTVNRQPAAADRAVPALKKTLWAYFFFRSSRSLPLTLFRRLSGEMTENTFLSIKKTKSVAYCGNFWSRSLGRFVRAAQFVSVSSCARRLLKHFRCKSLQIIWDTDRWWIPVSCDISRTLLWVCGLSSWLSTKSLTVSTFSSVRAQKLISERTVTRKILFTISMEKDWLYFKHRKYQNLWINNKVRGDCKCNLCVFFHICRKFEFLVSRGSVATCLRWGG